VIWGLLHGCALVVERIFGVGDGAASGRRLALPAAVTWLITFHFVCITWVFFRSPTLEAALSYFATLFAGNGWGTSATPLVATMLVLGAMTQVIPAAWFALAEAWYDRSSMAVRIAVPTMVIFVIAVAAPNGVPPFIYFQF
jgi:alginate O-acetyltransferase complex protein AlgI